MQPAAQGSDYFIDSGGFYFGAIGADDDILSQTVGGLVATCTYQLAYTLRSSYPQRTTPNDFTPSVDGNVLLDSNGNSLAQTDFVSGTAVPFSGVFTATSTSAALSFAGRNVPDFIILTGSVFTAQ